MESFETTARTDIKQLKLGPLRLAKRGPSLLGDGANGGVQMATHPLGFDGASDADQIRWLHRFSRLLAGVRPPSQVVIETEPGFGAGATIALPRPRDFGRMMGPN